MYWLKKPIHSLEQKIVHTYRKCQEYNTQFTAVLITNFATVPVNS